MANNTTVIIERKPETDQDILLAAFGTKDADHISKRSLISVMRRQQGRMNALIEALFKENPNHPLLRNMSEKNGKSFSSKDSKTTEHLKTKGHHERSICNNPRGQGR